VLTGPGLSADQIRRIFEIFEAADPAPRTELGYNSPFELLVAVILSAQATDVSVNKVTPGLFGAANTPEAMLKLGEEELKRHISSIGLYNNKAKNIIRTCEMLVREHGGEVPGERAALERLPGVGRKSANIMLNIVFGQPTMAVDTHIFRVGNRTGLAPGKTPLEVEKGLLEVIPKKFMRHAHHWLVLHGRYICMARKPKCHVCPIESECQWPEKPVA